MGPSGGEGNAPDGWWDVLVLNMKRSSLVGCAAVVFQCSGALSGWDLASVLGEEILGELPAVISVV